MNLNDLRKKIDSIDGKVVKMLNERAGYSQEIGARKLKHKKGIYAPHREKEVLERLAALNEGPMPDGAFEAIYREIMSSSIALEKPLSIANLGIRGSYSSIAARKKFGSQIEYTSCRSIADVFTKVENEECDYGVVPIENSTEGAVTHTFDMLVDSELKICSQVLLKISHNLLSKEPIDKIKKIHSNPQVFAQCRNWLLKNMPNADQIWESSTTKAAEITSKQKGHAALGSVEAAEVYKLKVLKKNIQDIPHNTTRFLIIGQNDADPTGKDRTSILFSIKDKVGALYSMLQPFYKNKINLTKIESRPSKKKAWDYYFFVDFQGHRSDTDVQKALGQLEEMCKYLKILGSYPVLE
ncbi:Chorismate mutase I / Prephenate dehydratase [hydrothermal vent metagenome]|uniref:Bifunctional chorismate mutase/prephenate dehydratase n=1 Tax=hydrothermal vent metagenome TaxID=652676 RepID=A0A3B1E371_9ZZZZ